MTRGQTLEGKRVEGICGSLRATSNMTHGIVQYIWFAWHERVHGVDSPLFLVRRRLRDRPRDRLRHLLKHRLEHLLGHLLGHLVMVINNLYRFGVWIVKKPWRD